MADSQADTEPAVIFLQMTRTAGNAMIAILLEEFGLDATYVLGPTTTYDDFREAARHDTKRLYAGHFLFGAHRHIPRPCTYFTTLRHPVEQLLSRYEAMSRRLGTRLDPADWLARDFESRNGMVKRLIGIGMLPAEVRVVDALDDRDMPEEFVVGPGEFDRAVDNIEKYFSCVLIMERFNQSLAILQRTLHTGPLFSLHRQFVNRADRPIRRQDYPAAVIDQIVEQNPYDLRLYEMFEKRLSDRIAAEDAAFHQDVDTLDLISQVLRDEESQTLGGADVLERLIVLVNELGHAGRGDDAVRVLRMFSAKTSTDRSLCQAVLKFTKAHGSRDDIADEIEKYRRRFGDDEFLGYFAKDAGI